VSKIEWDVRAFEQSPAFKVVKHEVKPNQVTWVLENKRNLGTKITFGWEAVLYDADGVQLTTIGIENEPFLFNMPKVGANASSSTCRQTS
jgi:hypothetical protein